MGVLKNIAYSTFAIVAYLYFLVILLQLVAFSINAGKELSWNGSLVGAGTLETFRTYFPYNIDYAYDTTLAYHPVMALIANMVSMSLWIIPHSLLARPEVKRMFGADPMDKTGIYRSCYVFFATLTWHVMMHFWQPAYTSSAPVWDVSENPIWNKLLICGYVAGILWLVTATFAIDHMELVGIKQGTGIDIYRMAGVSVEGFTTRLHYRLMRHPMMTGWFFIFFSIPTMTWNHLLFSVVMTTYIHVAVKFFEEPRMQDHFGVEYKTYMRTTGSYCPMPFIGGKKKDESFTPLMEEDE